MANAGLFTNCGIFAGGYNISGRANAVNLLLSREIKDRSVFGNTARVKAAGLEAAQLTVTGFYDASEDTERVNWDANTPVSVFIPATGSAAVAAGDRAIFFTALEAGFKRGAQFGEDAMFTFDALGPNYLGYPVGVGHVLNPGLVAVTADNTPAASIVQLTAAAANQYVYGVLHVTSVSTDDTIIVKIQSDALVGFTTPTDVITFASKAAIGSELAVRVAGDGSGDTYWRAIADVTISGAPCSITFACAMAIR